MKVTLVTPTFARDYERFVFQRETLERCGIDLPHVAVVDTEDMGKFRDMPFQKNLTLVASCDVLGRALDKRRTVWGISRKDYRYWITGKGVHGWTAQQLMKLSVAMQVKTEGVVCLDSDTFFVDRVEDADFVAADGRLHLYATDDDVDVEMARWYAQSLQYFGIKQAGVALRRFTHSPVPMHGGVVRDMTKRMEELHGKPWTDAIIHGDGITEYTTYGTYAMHVDECRRVCPVRPGLTLYYWWKSDGEPGVDLEGRLARQPAKMVLVNSNMGKDVEAYRKIIKNRQRVGAEGPLVGQGQ